ncbi:hypothetical protein [Streptomyces wuyuanensis]|uniref:hypothetical protein n=1 Tax=Streptomyces wuyuanensis TaxID=1196353 RepID=UPI003D70780B
MTDHPPSASLPDPHRIRPSTAADAVVVHQPVAACERERPGRVRTGQDASPPISAGPG